MSEKRRGGLLDAFIVTVILLSVAGIVLRMQALRVTEENDAVFTVYATVKSVYAEAADCIAAGETLYLADGTVYGTVAEIGRSAAKIRLLSEGEVYEGEWTDGRLLDLTLSITVTGRDGGDMLLRDGRYVVLVGESVTLYGERVALSATVSAVKKS